MLQDFVIFRSFHFEKIIIATNQPAKNIWRIIREKIKKYKQMDRNDRNTRWNNVESKIKHDSWSSKYNQNSLIGKYEETA